IIKKHLPSGQIAPALLRDAPKAVLGFQQRRRSRQRITLDNGLSVGMMLHQGTVLQHGDVLVGDDGSLAVVEAAIETVLHVSSEQPQQLARAAYHLGNRHTLVEIGAGYLQLEDDPILLAMLNQLGDLSITRVQAAFSPDTGAYGKGHKH